MTTGLDAAQAFLLAQRIGSVWAEPFETALALLAILPRLRDTALVADSLTALADAQLPNGSWENDVYITALALRAVTLAQTPIPNPDLSTVQGRVLDGDTGVALSGVAVALSGAASATLVTSSDGWFQFSGLPAGRYHLALSVADYGTLTTTTTLPIGGSVDFGALSLLKNPDNPTTGTVRGVVTEAETQAPFAGVTVTVAGLTARTSHDGSYQLSHVPPGPVIVTASRDGYASASGSGDLVAGGVLVFSPSLRPSLNATADAALFGRMTDATTGTPLAGVTVRVSGSTTATAHTDSTGAYRITPLQAGSITIAASLVGYDAVGASATVVEHAQISFAPALYPTATTPPSANASRLTGVVVDATTNAPLADVTVEASHGAVTDGLTTTGDGRFTITDITAAEVHLHVTLDGYDPSDFALPLAPLSTLDIGQVRLRPDTVDTLLPDVVVASVDASSTVTDPSTLAASGTVRVVIRNQGTSAASPGIALLAFDDANQNGIYESDSEARLGSAVSTEGLAVEGDATLDIVVQGVLSFRDAPISVWVDSAQAVVERDEHNNVGLSAALCRDEPGPVGAFDPVLEWAWIDTTGSNIQGSMMTPVVAPLIDTTGDGTVDAQDVPAILFIADGHRLMAIRGDNGAEIFAVTDPQYRVGAGEGFSQIAVGDIDNDGLPEIITVPVGGGRLIAFEHDGSMKWFSGPVPGLNYGGPALADLDHDGVPEVIAAATVLNADGTVRWTGSFGQGVNQGFVCCFSVVADVDSDGHPEVITGNTVYRADGTVLWQDTSRADGWPAVGNFDDDSFPEILVVSEGTLRLYEHDGTLAWGPVSIPGGGSGGPPTVADFDSDGAAEVGVAGSSYYTVWETDGTVKWSNPTRDHSSHITGSSAFDFEGDGTAEVVYNDEYTLWVYRGSDGATLFSIPNSSGTLLENPVIADVDRDGQAEIIVVRNNWRGRGTSLGLTEFGIFVYGDALDNWVPTRGIWNQHTYHITNVNDDGTIPQFEAPSWLSHNTYRLNAFPDRHPLDRADLTAAVLQLIDHGTGQPLSLRVRIGNAGLLTLSQPVTVAFYQGDPDTGGVLLGAVDLPRLAGRRFQDVQLDGVTLASTDDLYAVVDPDDSLTECNEHNNVVAIAVASAASLGRIAVAIDAPGAGPNSPVDFTATVTNLGSLAAAYDVQFHLEDSNGARVVTFPSLPVATLTGGTSVSLSQAWNTGNTLTGAYLLVGTLTDLSGTVLGDATAAFVIRAGTAAHASLRTTTDRAVYHTTATIAVDTLTRNLTRNALLAGTVIEMRVLGPSGTTVSQTTLSVGDLAPGAQREVATTYTLQASPEGRYTIATELRDADGVVLAADQTTFAVVEDLGLTLSGRVDVQQAVIAPGDAQRCTDTVINHGTQNLSAQPMRQLVVRLDDETLVTRTDSTVALAPGAKQTLLRTIDTAGLEAGDYACVLQTQRGGAWHTLDAAVFTVQQAPFQLDADVTLGDRGRVLVLLDGPKTGQSDTCYGVTQVGLATTFTPPLAPDTSVEVEVFDTDGALVDAEDSTLERFTSPVNANAGTMGDLSLSDFTSERLAFILTESNPAKGTLGKAYTWTVTLASTDEAFLLTSGPIHTSCSQPLAVDDGYGDFVIDELMVMTADDSDDPHGPDIAPALEAQQAFLAHLLTQAGWSSTIVTDADSFTQAFRRGGYTTYLVLAEQVKLANQVQKELREAVYRGEGLLVAGDHDQRNHYLAEPLGVKYKGKTSKATGLVLQASNLHPAAQTALLISDKVNKVTVTGATAVGTFQVQGNAQGKKAHDDLIAVAVRDYGTGRAVYMGFDLLAEATFAGADSVFAHLLVHTLEYIQPIVPATITGAVVPVHLTVTGQENPPPVHAVITVPLEAPVVAVETTAGAVDHPTDDELVWAVELADGVREELILWLRLPDVPGPVDVTVVLQLGEGAERTEYDRLSLTLEVEQLPGLLEAFAELDELAMQDNAYHQAQQRLAQADQALAQGDEAKALTELVKTADALIKVGTVEAEEMHAAIAEALRQVPQWLVDSDT